LMTNLILRSNWISCYMFTITFTDEKNVLKTQFYGEQIRSHIKTKIDKV